MPSIYYREVNQSSFRPGRSTTTQILALRGIIEGVRRKNLPAVMVFVDFCKAFDSISHSIMFKILEAHGIPCKLLRAVKATFDNLKAKFVSPDGDTQYFNICAGVMRGDTLAPFLLVIVLDYAVRKFATGRKEDLGFTLVKRRSKRQPALCLCDLDFADDLVLLSNEIDQAKKLVQAIEKESGRVSLKLDTKKTKAMFFNTPPATIQTLERKSIGQAITESCKQDFKYLGRWCDQTNDLHTRKALAWKALNKLDKIWKSDLSKKHKLNFFRATVESVLLYGCATWTLTKVEKALDGTCTRMLKKVYNVDGRAHITNEALYSGLDKISSTVRSRRLEVAGHTHRDKTSPAHLTVTWEPAHGESSRGRPPTSFVDTLPRDTGLDVIAQLKQCMSDRVVCRNLSRGQTD